MYLVYSVNVYIFNVVIKIKFYSILLYWKMVGSIVSRHVISTYRQNQSIFPMQINANSVGIRSYIYARLGLRFWM